MKSKTSITLSEDILRGVKRAARRGGLCRSLVSTLSASKLRELDRALVAALGIDVENLFE